jgi:hypothetical protein
LRTQALKIEAYFVKAYITMEEVMTKVQQVMAQRKKFKIVFDPKNQIP